MPASLSPSLCASVLIGALCAWSPMASAQNPHRYHAQMAVHGCSHNDSGLKLPPGFCASIFADGIGHARYMVVAPNGVLYVNTWSGRYYGNDTPHAGGFLVALQDTAGSGKADVIRRFGETVQSGGTGGRALPYTKGRFSPKSTTRSFVMRFLAAPSYRAILRWRSYPDCRWAAIIRCTRSLSTRPARCMSMSLPQPMLVNSRIERRCHPVSRRARALRPPPTVRSSSATSGRARSCA